MRNNAFTITITIAMLPFVSHAQAQTQMQVQTPLTVRAPLLQPDAHAQPQHETVARPPVTEQPIEAPLTRVGDATIAWLAIQREGRFAAPEQPMLGVEADAAYRRYLKSFDHPIPARLNSPVAEVGGGSGAGAQN
jgi:hypothetical protein